MSWYQVIKKVIKCILDLFCIGYTLKEMENLISRAISMPGMDLDGYASNCK